MEDNRVESDRTHVRWFDDVGFFGVLTHKQSYLNIIYLLLSFPLGIFYFVFIVTGLSLGFGLAILGVGLFILLAVLIALRGFAAVERQLCLWLLGEELATPDLSSDPWRHPLIALKKFATDSYTWRSLVYLVAKFPLGIVSFVIVVSLVGTTLAMVLAPLLYQFAPVEIFTWRVVRAEEALLCLAIGIILGFLTVHALNGIAALWRNFTAWMLMGEPARNTPLKHGPIVIP